MLPGPALQKLSSPGRDFTSATNSLKVLAGTAGFTSSTLMERASWLMDRKSLIGS
ncbi:hypothetical protein D3C72_1306660 [compost metagenome]